MGSAGFRNDARLARAEKRLKMPRRVAKRGFRRAKLLRSDDYGFAEFRDFSGNLSNSLVKFFVEGGFPSSGRWADVSERDGGAPVGANWRNAAFRWSDLVGLNVGMLDQSSWGSRPCASAHA
jgi:hypothetical protein